MTRKTGVKKDHSKMKQRFCFELARLGNAELAAAIAGYKDPAQKSGELMMEEKVLDEAIRYAEKLKKLSTITACAGFRQLAFDSVEDAVRLIFLDNVREDDIEGMNLLSISEIKRNKDKGIEIKFFDRIKSLEKLAQLQEDSVSAAGGIFEALSAAARNEAQDRGV